jgi:site-specific recombinase XerD
MSHDSFLSSLIAGNPAEPLLRRFVDYLIVNRYSASAATAYVRAAVHLGRWLDGRPITLELTNQYLNRHLPQCRCKPIAPRDRRWNAGMIRHLLSLAGIVRPVVEGVGDEILKQYREYLVRERGLKPVTVVHFVYYAARTFRAFRPGTLAEIKRWTAADVQSHARAELAGHTGSTNNSKTAIMRVFFRFLHRQQFTTTDLSQAIPKVPFWRSANVPEAIDSGVVKQLLAASEADRTPQGLRNHLILLSLHELGIRASDLLSLQLGDMQLDKRVLDVRRPKGRRELVLPISKRLADAFGAYINRGRPRCDASWVFVHHRAPAGKRLTTAGVRDILVGLSLRAGLATPIENTHTFRRALAGRLLSAGATLKQIADVLGHRSIDTTAHYARMDTQAIAVAAMPWPAGREVQP